MRVSPAAADAAKRRRSGLYLFLLLLAALLIVGAAIVAPFVIPVLLGVVLSIISRPLHVRLRRLGAGPRLASGIVVVGLVVLIVGPTAWFGFAAAKQGVAVGQALAENDSLSLDRIAGAVGKIPYAQDVLGAPDAIEKTLRAGTRSLGKRALALGVAIVSGAPAIVLQLFLALVTCYFFLVDGERFTRWILEKSGLDPVIARELGGVFRDTSFGVILSTMAAATAQAALMFAAYLLLGVPGAFLAAGATFLFAWIPVLGSTPVWVTGTLYLYLHDDSPAKAVVMLVLGGITGVVDNFIRPLVLKGRGGIHPLVSLVAIFGGIELFGILGVFFGPILAALLVSTVELWPLVRKRMMLVPDDAFRSDAA